MNLNYASGRNAQTVKKITSMDTVANGKLTLKYTDLKLKDVACTGN
ncbi:MAG: hypothetical protein ABFD07_18520 [Methanobacterium sp.]